MINRAKTRNHISNLIDTSENKLLKIIEDRVQ